ncbi:protein O-GlcNAcase [Kosmotoga olearia]|jgi:hyaluronoglucosaminidase|uniref:Hyaluronidase n=1 Tax=Kosmotoga olearia (strain ATCC BAA-1733 / DSM 21960 / TBF 19.5.1) TaxID=521045 RepID=C5CIL3_KOSOT|nr:protein O-GlcNAcase [Kosmotoga olearia]ACR79875.1 Hyaluronidase [Kosmotoga olearia TBF 19.5.1]
MNAFKIRGVVEGFYGKPWSMEDRMEMIPFLGNHGYNLYIYAPKDDSFHRYRWRETYSYSFMKDFEKLVKTGEKSGVEVAFAISPGLSIVHSDPEELRTIVEKYLSFAKLGVRSFCLFYDDIPPSLSPEDAEKFGNLAEAQIYFANSVYEELKKNLENTLFIVCPTEYCTNYDTPYLRKYGEKLNPEIHIFWTGPECCSKDIPESDAIMISKTIKRKPLYWDNYPVNDSYMVPELHIGPYTGRAPELVNYSAGLLLNPMNLPEASKVVLAAASRFLLDPYNYNAEKAWEEALEEIFGEAHEEAKHFALCNLTSPLYPEEPEITKEIVEKFHGLFKMGKFDEAIEHLKNEAEKFIKNAEKLRENISRKMLRDIEPWLKEYEAWGKILGFIVKVLEVRKVLYTEKFKKEDLYKIKEAILALQKHLSELTGQNTLCCGSALRDFAMEVLVRTKGILKLFDYTTPSSS